MMRLLAFILCRIFFKRISVSGTPYTGGSAIWAANHSSGIVDPAVMLGLAPVTIRPLAKHTLWEMPVMKQILQITKAIPVTRLQDIKKDVQAQKEMLQQGNFDPDWRAKANNEAFQAVGDALLKGDCILIFPEGVSHDDPYIYKFKTGLARMALQAMSRANDENFHVVVQPVVIDYSEKDEFRSELNLHYCEPVVITSADNSVNDIMDGVRESLEAGFASFFSWDEKRNWRFLFELSYGRQAYSSREFRIFVEKLRPEFDVDPILMARIQTMRRMMQAVNVSPIQLVWGDVNYKRRNFFWVIFRHGWFYLFLTLPIEFLGTIVWAIPSKFCESLAKKSTSDRDVRATMKIAHGMWFFPLWAFFTSSVFTYLLGAYLPHINKIVIWVAFLILTPTFLALSLMVRESINFFPGFLRLAKLRFFFPRGWYELMKEWREISDGVMLKIKSQEESKKPKQN
ncbi:1-acyl-sn-glycerol-3-phosphate acyltransferase [Fluviispira vulneris]|uniref:1-acyl-sn-glycerol-3-phosphate acyltransferase n=1 Tax=Fluviispira vulneris TaxID=2763012 RepID=UPI0016452D3F|nr:1-acyl-sn-glycerol-3-phosphate acyltransferase [Fluviispira vulneris]